VWQSFQKIGIETAEKECLGKNLRQNIMADVIRRDVLHNSAFGYSQDRTIEEIPTIQIVTNLQISNFTE